MWVTILQLILRLLAVVYPKGVELKQNKELEDVAKAYSKQAQQIQKNETMSDDELVDSIVASNERLRK